MGFVPPALTLNLALCDPPDQNKQQIQSTSGGRACQTVMFQGERLDTKQRVYDSASQIYAVQRVTTARQKHYLLKWPVDRVSVFHYRSPRNATERNAQRSVCENDPLAVSVQQLFDFNR